MDPLRTLFANAWQRFAARFWVLIWIFFIPGALLVAGRLLSGRAGAGVRTVTAGGILSFIGTVVSIIASLAIINALAHGTDFKSSYRVGVKLFWAALWISILNVLVVVGGLVLLIVPGIILAVGLAFSNYALVIEDRRGFSALMQSREYVRGYWWAVVGRALLVTLIFFAALLIIYAPALLILGQAIGSVVYLVLLLCFTAFSMSYTYEIFENLRRQKPARRAAPVAEGKRFLIVCFSVGIIAVAIFAFLGLIPGGFLHAG